MKNLALNMLKETVKYWWISLIVGLLAIATGVLAFTMPMGIIAVLTVFFVANFLASGIFDIFFAISNHKNLNGWGWNLTLGIISVVFAIFLLLRPVESMLAFVLLAGFWVMFTSIASISGSVEMQRAGIGGWGWLLAFGIIGIVLSYVLIINPSFAASFIVGIFAITMMLYGTARIYYAFTMRRINEFIKKRLNQGS